MFYTGLDPRDMQPVYVPRDPAEKALQRALMHALLVVERVERLLRRDEEVRQRGKLLPTGGDGVERHRADAEEHRMLVLFEYAQQFFGVIRIRARAVDPAEIIAGLRHRHCGCTLDVRPCLRHDHAVARAVQRTHRRDGRAVFSVRHKRCFHFVITAVFSFDLPVMIPNSPANCKSARSIACIS